MAYSDEASKKGDKSLPIAFRRITGGLINNASSLLELRARRQIISALESWCQNLATFEDTKERLRAILTTRDLTIAGKFLSGDLHTILSSFGFFSFLYPASDAKLQKRTTPQALILRSSLLIKQRRKKIIKVLIDMNQSKAGVETGYALETLSFFTRTGDQDRNSGLVPGDSGRCLIVGPSDSTIPELGYHPEITIALVSPSLDIDTLDQLISKHQAIPLLNNVAATLVIGDPNSRLSRIVRQAKMVYCAPQFVEEFERHIGMPARTYDSRFLQTWEQGSPNLLHRAIGVALDHNLKVEIVGANLYGSKVTYSSAMNNHPYGAMGNSPRRLHEFFTCISYSNHEPIPNFISVKRLYKSGVIATADPALSSVLAGNLTEYLETLEETLGKLRK
jgi:hypothetical protein